MRYPPIIGRNERNMAKIFIEMVENGFILSAMEYTDENPMDMVDSLIGQFEPQADPFMDSINSKNKQMPKKKNEVTYVFSDMNEVIEKIKRYFEDEYNDRAMKDDKK